MGRNGDTADANWTEGGGKTRDIGDVTELPQASERELERNRKFLSLPK